MKHPNIVRLFDVIETDKYIGIILEYANGTFTMNLVLFLCACFQHRLLIYLSPVCLLMFLCISTQSNQSP